MLQGIPENETEEITSRYKGDGPSASQLADQISGDGDGSSCTCESTDSMPSPATPLSEHDAEYFVFPADLSDAISATTGMALIDEQSR